MRRKIFSLKSPFRSLRQFVAAFVLLVVLPGLLLALVQAWWLTRQLVDGPEREARSLATSAAESMGNHLRTMTESAAVFAHMPLGKDQFASFYQVAKGFADQIGYRVTLADADGNQFMTTRLPFGVQPPQRTEMASVHEAVANGRPHVSDLFQGRLAGTYVIAVDVPVRTSEGMRIVTIASNASAISGILSQTTAPKGWQMGLIDSKGMFIARGKDPKQWVGKFAQPSLIQAVRQSSSGVIRDASAEGVPMLNVFHRVPGSGWTILIGIPDSILYAPVIWPLGLLAGSITLTIALTALLAFLFIRQLNAAANMLFGVAQDPLEAGKTSSLLNSFAEFEEIANVLKTVAVKRQRMAAVLDQSAALSQTNEALKQEIEERKRVEAALHEEKAHQHALIRQLEEAQSQLLQSEKMASIGQLAAGVAHEINNPIGFVSSNLSTMSDYTKNLLAVLAAYERLADPLLSADPDTLADISAARDSAELDYLRQDLPSLLLETKEGIQRVRDIVLDLREFSHVGETTWQQSDLHKGLNSTLNMVKNEIKFKAEVIKEYGEISLVECIASEINQVFMNLLVNAAQAIAEKGVITLRTGQRDDRVWVEVADTGAGIEPENLTRIFDPFFTTKPIGKGTGLGLSVSYGIVRKHGGKIEVESEIGKGTTFRLWLPVRQSVRDAEARSASLVK